MEYPTFVPPFYSTVTTTPAPLPNFNFNHGYTPPSPYPCTPSSPNPYPSLTSYSNPYGYGYSSSYNSYQPNHPYSQPVGAYQHTSVSSQPVSSFQNNGSHTRSTSYSSTYYHPTDYGGYQNNSSSYASQQTRREALTVVINGLNEMTKIVSTPWLSPPVQTSPGPSLVAAATNTLIFGATSHPPPVSQPSPPPSNPISPPTVNTSSDSLFRLSHNTLLRTPSPITLKSEISNAPKVMTTMPSNLNNDERLAAPAFLPPPPPKPPEPHNFTRRNGSLKTAESVFTRSLAARPPPKPPDVNPTLSTPQKPHDQVSVPPILPSSLPKPPDLSWEQADSTMPPPPPAPPKKFLVPLPVPVPPLKPPGRGLTTMPSPPFNLVFPWVLQQHTPPSHSRDTFLTSGIFPAVMYLLTKLHPTPFDQHLTFKDKSQPLHHSPPTTALHVLKPVLLNSIELLHTPTILQYVWLHLFPVNALVVPRAFSQSWPNIFSSNPWSCSVRALIAPILYHSSPHVRPVSEQNAQTNSNVRILRQKIFQLLALIVLVKLQVVYVLLVPSNSRYKTMDLLPYACNSKGQITMLGFGFGAGYSPMHSILENCGGSFSFNDVDVVFFKQWDPGKIILLANC